MQTRPITLDADPDTLTFEIRSKTCPLQGKRRIPCLSGLERAGEPIVVNRCDHIAPDTLDADAKTIGCNHGEPTP